MRCDLKRTFGDLAHAIPSNVWEGKHTLFTAGTLPPLSPHLETDRLVITKEFHDYDNYFRADLLTFQACSPVYRELALLILAIVLSPDVDEVHLALTHPKSDVKEVIISCAYEQEEHGLISHPAAYTYWPKEVGAYSQIASRKSRLDLPSFRLAGVRDSLMSSAWDWEQRATIVGFGTAQGNVLFANVLLDVGRPNCEVYEYEIGYAFDDTCAPASAEVRLWLPGHGYWDDELLPKENPGTKRSRAPR